MNIGDDQGFHTVKAMADGGRQTVFPSFAARPSDSLFSMNGHQAAIITSTRTGCLQVGESAVKMARAGARLETASWVSMPEYLAMFYRALSDLTPARGVSVNLVTGLPLADYARDKDKLRSLLLGTHTFTRQELGHQQTITVDSLRVVPQAWGAVLALLLDSRGAIVQPELMQEKVAALDIGGHTVNYLSVDGLSDIPAETRGTDRGAWNVVRAVRDYLDTAHPGLSRMNDHAIMQAVAAGEVWDQGERIDLDPITRPVLDDIGQEIVSTAAQYWGDGASTFRRVLVIGGGAYLWGEHVKRAFRQAVIFDRPELVNALGFYRFAVYLAREG